MSAIVIKNFTNARRKMRPAWCSLFDLLAFMLGLAHTRWRSHYRDWRVRRLTRWRVRILLDGVGVGIGVCVFVMPIGVVLVCWW